MKTFVLFILFGLSAGQMFAGNIKIQLFNDKGSVMPFVDLSINGEFAATTDSSGVAVISDNDIAVGDTLSASCLGTEPARLVFTQTLKTQGSCDLVLQEKYYMLDEVEVLPNADMEPFFEKSIRNIFFFKRNGLLSAHFAITVQHHGQPSRRVEGSLTVENEVTGPGLERPFQYGAFHHPIRFTTRDDTTGLSKIMDAYIREALRGGTADVAAFLVDRWARHQMRKNRYDMRFDYLGEENGILRFRVLSTFKADKRFSIQSILSIDKESKLLQHSESRLISPPKSEKSVIYSRSRNWLLDADYVTFKHKSSPAVLLPKTIHSFSDDRSDGFSVEIDLTEIQLQVK